jgi:hypothetical protein
MEHANEEMNNIYNRGLKLKFIKGPNSKEKMMLRGLLFIGKKAFTGRILQEKLSKYDKFDQTLYSCHFLRCLQAAQIHLAGHIRLASRVFETPDLRHLGVSQRERSNLKICC